ncbi:MULTISPECIES: cell wall synthase accessory phosphoprotein MacP [unclassified Enterococcus]|uniref:cell wall synthase accessory phosphoprotein MacP n=1 Tax=unclassified Enterococcus TaxID=2608891 RepID=UPI0015536080|nr:cell wall synthase accessory phosphoprotein MacP [Enterococcus sp. MMGLQ5-2]MBS7584231.1 cell wall synthase accessory phosphoprotein MacP [Enterococcus sp. MMGLQ5-1]NPD12087.1 hypothetical protein [Enterococcus sp. MMGLQ5-1]NPD36659.1 hypothetical protein [Enterococcus sp. MMGLQ5-2]
MSKPLVTREALRKEREKQERLREQQIQESESSYSEREKAMYNHYRKERKKNEKSQVKSNRTIEQYKSVGRRRFLNRALFIVIVLLALLIFAIWRL